jgi:hypothetical protein
MLCCWKKTTEVKTLSKPLLAESKSVTGEPKILTERRTPSVPVPIKSELIPSKTFPVSPPKLDSAYSYPASIPAPIYVKSELPPVELKPISIPVEVKPTPVPAPVEVKLTPVEVKPIPVPAPVEVKQTPVEVKPTSVPAPVEVKQTPVEVKPTLPEDNPTPIETKPIQKKNFKSNKRG